MLLQLEITTRCNFDCFYCAGRTMRQADMPYARFAELLEAHIARYGVPGRVSLQGEGEPTLHHDFFRMAQRVREAGAVPYTITNGTYKHPERFVGLFPRVGVSVDTLDGEAAAKIGRFNLPRVLSFIEALAPHAEIVVHSVAHELHTPRVAGWCRQRGYRHVIQPLQTKADYARRYPQGIDEQAPFGRFSCVYLQTNRMRYHTLSGVEMPCCFIKDESRFEGMEAMRGHQLTGTCPSSCVGCRFARFGSARTGVTRTRTAMQVPDG